MLGRRIDSNLDEEPVVISIIGMPNLSGKERFGCLLLQKAIEEISGNKNRIQE